MFINEFLSEFESEVSQIDSYLENRIRKTFSSEEGLAPLLNSQLYSIQSGGKRFRPLLSVFVAKTFGRDIDEVIPWGAAVEMIHTYSLIHDDLPAMDDDEFRRGQLTNHKVFGEAVAILAGDALLTDAFNVLADGYSKKPATALKLVKILSEAAGSAGMVGGQVLDIQASNAGRATLEELTQIHRLKTGRLILAAVYGAGVALELPEEKLIKLQTYGAELGFAFQVADDIEDFIEGKKEASGLPQLIGLEATQKMLLESSQRAKAAIEQLQGLSPEENLLVRLVDFNKDRVSEDAISQITVKKNKNELNAPIG